MYFPKITLFLSLKIVFVLANFEGPDEKLHSAAFYLDLHFLQNTVNPV